MQDRAAPQKDAYALILEAIDSHSYKPGDRLVESELADRFGVSRTPVREALQRLETQNLLTRDGRSLIVASLDHNQLAELYVVRGELEGLAARLAARHQSAGRLIEDHRKTLDKNEAEAARAIAAKTDATAALSKAAQDFETAQASEAQARATAEKAETVLAEAEAARKARECGDKGRRREAEDWSAVRRSIRQLRGANQS